MQPDEINVLINNSIKKSKKALNTAYDLIDNDLITTQNRAYYAVFYIVLALGYLKGFTTAKHSQLMGWFNKEFIYNNQVFDKYLNVIYTNLYLNRKKFDYDVMAYPQKEDILKDLDDAHFFIKTIEEYINNDKNNF